MTLLRHENLDIRLITAEGITRLLICEKVEKPPEYLAGLLLLYFSKEDEQPQRTSG